jgi:hypothetical protein
VTRPRALLVVLLAIGVLGAAIALTIVVHAPSASPDDTTAAAPTASRAARPEAARSMPRALATDPPSDARGYTKFVAPRGIEARPAGTDPALRYPIPDGGFARWTGREGTWPGELEEFARTAGLPLDVALEQRRSTLLAERTADAEYLGELLGAPPTAEMRAAIDAHASALHEATARIQVDAREGRLAGADAIRETRAAEEAYRRGYLEATGLSEQQFERFFAPDRPLP